MTSKEKSIVNYESDDDKYIQNKAKDGNGEVGKSVTSTSYLEQEKRRAEKKNLKVIDHSAVQYEPISKNLYIEVKEVSSMTER